MSSSFQGPEGKDAYPWKQEPLNGVPSQGHATKDDHQTSLKSQPKQQRPKEGAPSKDEHFSKNKNQNQSPPPPSPPLPSEDQNFHVPSSFNVEHPEKDKQPIKNHPKLTSDEPVLAYPEDYPSQPGGPPPLRLHPRRSPPHPSPPPKRCPFCSICSRCSIL